MPPRVTRSSRTRAGAGAGDKSLLTSSTSETSTKMTAKTTAKSATKIATKATTLTAAEVVEKTAEKGRGRRRRTSASGDDGGESVSVAAEGKGRSGRGRKTRGAEGEEGENKDGEEADDREGVKVVEVVEVVEETQPEPVEKKNKDVMEEKEKETQKEETEAATHKPRKSHRGRLAPRQTTVLSNPDPILAPLPEDSEIQVPGTQLHPPVPTTPQKTHTIIAESPSTTRSSNAENRIPSSPPITESTPKASTRQRLDYSSSAGYTPPPEDTMGERPKLRALEPRTLRPIDTGELYNDDDEDELFRVGSKPFTAAVEEEGEDGDEDDEEPRLPSPTPKQSRHRPHPRPPTTTTVTGTEIHIPGVSSPFMIYSDPKSPTATPDTHPAAELLSGTMRSPEPYFGSSSPARKRSSSVAGIVEEEEEETEVEDGRKGRGRRTRARGRKKRAEMEVDTDALRKVLPRRRRREVVEEVETEEESGEEVDELSRPVRRRVKGKGKKVEGKKKVRTYGRRKEVVEEEEEGSGMEDAAVVEGGIDGRGRRELERVREKFREVDQWEMEFEDVSVGTSPTARRVSPTSPSPSSRPPPPPPTAPMPDTSHPPSTSPPSQPSSTMRPSSTAPDTTSATNTSPSANNDATANPPSTSPPTSPRKKRPTTSDLHLDQYVRRDQLHAAALISQNSRAHELIRVKREEATFFSKTLRSERQRNPGVIFGFGYSGYGNGFTDLSGPGGGGGTRVLYPCQRKRPGGRKARELRLSRKQIREQADLPEVLVPVRLDVEFDKVKLRDTFTWNLHENAVPVDIFAEQLVEDFHLPVDTRLVQTVAQSIREQVTEFHPHIVLHDEPLDPKLPYSAYKNDDMRILIKLNITIGQHTLEDQFEWDINNPQNSPEEFARLLTREMSLAGEFTTAIAHAIREQSQLFTRALYVTSHPFDGRPIEDEDVRSAMLQSPIQSVLRPHMLQKDFSPTLYELSDHQLDRVEKAFSRDSRRTKRLARGLNRRGGPTIPDLKEMPKTHRTQIVSSVLPGAVAKLSDLEAKMKAKEIKDGESEEEEDDDDEDLPPEKVIPNFHNMTKRQQQKALAERNALMAASRADVATPGPGLRGATPEVSTPAAQVRERRARAEREESHGGKHSFQTPHRGGGHHAQSTPSHSHPHHHQLQQQQNQQTPIIIPPPPPPSTTTSRTLPTPPTPQPPQPPQYPPLPRRPDAPPGADSALLILRFHPARFTKFISTLIQTSRFALENPPPPVLSSTPVPAPTTPTPSTPTATNEKTVPSWLTTSLATLNASYPDDKFEGTMRLTATDPATGQVVPQNAVNDGNRERLRFRWCPRIRCSDCPGKLYTPGPGETVENFVLHLKNRGHREKVAQRKAREAGGSGAAPATQQSSPSALAQQTQQQANGS
ncbi:SNF5-domain-containing protein [Ascodesmis nigricans]|uniref:SNF5-domain-containing protein n=1 Tax=Ascodesmis nigricans TaxID=341454 RepID=A0A4S2MU29_9PEZI|nr:SNF5-domain-containing protein [Ascodesmis nigricans]